MYLGRHSRQPIELISSCTPSSSILAKNAITISITSASTAASFQCSSRNPAGRVVTPPELLHQSDKTGDNAPFVAARGETSAPCNTASPAEAARACHVL